MDVLSLVILLPTLLNLLPQLTLPEKVLLLFYLCSLPRLEHQLLLCLHVLAHLLSFGVLVEFVFQLGLVDTFLRIHLLVVLLLEVVLQSHVLSLTGLLQQLVLHSELVDVVVV